MHLGNYSLTVIIFVMPTCETFSYAVSHLAPRTLTSKHGPPGPTGEETESETVNKKYQFTHKEGTENMPGTVQSVVNIKIYFVFTATL